MKLTVAASHVLALFASTNAFRAPSMRRSLVGTSPTALYGMSRKARRQQKREDQKNRPNTFNFLDKDLTDDDTKKDEVIIPSNVPAGEMGDGKEVAKDVEDVTKGESLESKIGGSGESATRGASIIKEDKLDERPDITQFTVDEETGIKRIIQGRCVMDVATRKAVKLSDQGATYRLAQMFPGVPPEVREKHRFDLATITVPEIVERLKNACYVDGKLPPSPQVTDEAYDFVIANRDLLGYRMKKTLMRLQMRAQWQGYNERDGDMEEARELEGLVRRFFIIEDSISAPFRQIMMEAEARVGPNFGNLDLKSYCDGEIYERTAVYLTLKGMVAYWEQKVKDADTIENSGLDEDKDFFTRLCVGDPKRYLPDPPILFTLNDCTRVCLMAQKMTSEFVSIPELFDDLPVEVRFVEKALSIQSGTALRKFMNEEFCPAEGITSAALREGLRRLHQQMANMQLDPYGDLTGTLSKLFEACSMGTDDLIDPYEEYILNPYPSGPGYFQTYTFDHDKNSLVQFLDSAKGSGKTDSVTGDDITKQIQSEVSSLFNFGRNIEDKSDGVKLEEETYVPPKRRAAGRPHMLGWLEALGNGEMMGSDSSGYETPSKEAKFEADNWEEVKS